MRGISNESKPLILVVDDEASVRKVLRKCFETEAYCVVEAFDRQSALDALNVNKVDLITLDVNLNGQDGLGLAREIRSESTVPIIMVSGKGELIDTVVGLEVGADDYIAKPFELREVLARVKSVLRRSRLIGAAVVQSEPSNLSDSVKHNVSFNNYTLSETSRDLITPDGEHHDLTTAEYNLLSVLSRHAQQVMSRDQILDAIKGTDWNPTDRSVDNQIARLRKKLDVLGLCNAIKTVRGIGYQFTLRVEHHQESAR